MKPAVIDTNVLLVANGSHPQASVGCRKVCVERLLAHKQSGVVVIDDAFRILGEYQHKTRPNQPKGVGDAFLKWLLQQAGNPARVHRVSINGSGADWFDQFPSKSLQERFDPPDRKFVAVANAHPVKPPVWQAADCKWLNWSAELENCGVRVDFLCPTDVATFYRKKYPGQAVPAFPVNGK